MVGVQSIADEVGWSARHLTERFRCEYGLTPKLAARLMRFERSHRLVQAGMSIAQAAGRCGYADQAHLTRDWRQFAGVSPARWMREDGLAFVQDRTGGSAAD